ncbi:hypothetical protein [Streptomyces sp. cmx-18-6]|uniref:hypothetical protein n=1 Tax=Streptomyces sp. cmx-18-6 TaxID=2790930 RepID=UPI00397F102C
MRSSTRKALAYSAGLAMMTVGLAFGTTTTASAASGCSGSLVGTYKLKQTNGTVMSTARVYYSTANGGTNCATNTAGLYYGKVTQLSVAIERGNLTGRQSDLGDYKYYAGPVRVTGTNGKCINIYVGATNGPSAGQTLVWQEAWHNIHCG